VRDEDGRRAVCRERLQNPGDDLRRRPGFGDALEFVDQHERALAALCEVGELPDGRLEGTRVERPLGLGVVV